MSPHRDPADRPLFGRWRYVFATEEWTIEPELLELLDAGSDDVHDLAPLVERIPEPARTEYVARLGEAIESRTGFAGQYPMRTDSRGMAVFALVGDVVRDDDGNAVELRGYSTDVTEEVRVATRAAVDAATRHRRAIEQVKGALMVTYRIDEVTAFALVRQQSNMHNVKLNVLSEHVSRAMGAAPRGGRVPLMELIEGVGRRLSGGHDDLPPGSHQIAT